MKEIGGYLELELPTSKEYHNNALRLNTGRNALEYIVRSKKYKKLYLPYYTCDVMLQPIQKLGLDFEFYKIDNQFFPIFDFDKIVCNEVFVYNNYFGICGENVTEVANICKNLIIDNSQAFYSKPLASVDTFYSPRKFFGVPDGAYLYVDKKLKDVLQNDISFNRLEHLLGRIDLDAGKFYKSFIENDKFLNAEPLKKMSHLTQRILSSINYQLTAEKRKTNFSLLHDKLKSKNQINILDLADQVPLCYPLLLPNGSDVKEKLISKKIYVPTYWPNVFEWASSNSFEYFLSKNLVCLPIDQRYGVEEMNIILENV